MLGPPQQQHKSRIASTNSPETNINDLCFINSLASAVSKVRTPDPEALAKAVEDKY